MSADIETMKLEAQQTLDELFSEGLIPFRLSAQLVWWIGMGEYIVRFQDEKLVSLDVSCEPGEKFRAVFRTAILARVARLSVGNAPPTTAERTFISEG